MKKSSKSTYFGAVWAGESCGGRALFFFFLLAKRSLCLCSTVEFYFMTCSSSFQHRFLPAAPLQYSVFPVARCHMEFLQNCLDVVLLMFQWLAVFSSAGSVLGRCVSDMRMAWPVHQSWYCIIVVMLVM